MNLVEIMENIQVIMLDILMSLMNFVVYLHSAFDYSWEIWICLCVRIYIFIHIFVCTSFQNQLLYSLCLKFKRGTLINQSLFAVFEADGYMLRGDIFEIQALVARGLLSSHSLLSCTYFIFKFRRTALFCV